MPGRLRSSATRDGCRRTEHMSRRHTRIEAELEVGEQAKRLGERHVACGVSSGANDADGPSALKTTLPIGLPGIK